MKIHKPLENKAFTTNLQHTKVLQKPKTIQDNNYFGESPNTTCKTAINP